MNKAEILENLNQIIFDLKNIRIKIKRVHSNFISKKNMRDDIQKNATIWFEKIEMQLTPLKISEKIVEKYHKYFEKLLQLTLTNSRKSSYLKTIDDILENFNSELIVTVMKSAIRIQQFKSLEKILTTSTEKEREYLKEAIGCANNDFFRASIVLGWSAAIHRIHKTVEKLGFDEFNKKSQEMKDVTSGRYKKFSKVFSIHNLSELQATVFDNDLLWVLEYWDLIDSNQHERLSICFTMRNNSGHPGEATVSHENLSSFYSDLETIVFNNKKFLPIE